MKWIVFLMVSLFFVVSMPFVAAAGDVNINIGVIPPPLEFAGPPDVVVVPSGTTYVYMVPDMPGMYFYHNYWYRFHEGSWFRSTIYNGPWVYFETSRVPLVIVNVPMDYYRHLPSGYYRIHYGDLHRNWRSWDKNRYWHKHDWYKREHETWRRDYYKPPPPRDGRKPPPPRDGHKPPLGDGHKPPPGDGHKPPPGDGHKPPPGDGHKPPPGDGHKPPPGDGHKPPPPRDGGGQKPPLVKQQQQQGPYQQGGQQQREQQQREQR